MFAELIDCIPGELLDPTRYSFSVAPDGVEESRVEPLRLTTSRRCFWGCVTSISFLKISSIVSNRLAIINCARVCGWGSFDNPV